MLLTTELSLELLLLFTPCFSGLSLEVLGTAIEIMAKQGRQDPGSNLCHCLRWVTCAFYASVSFLYNGQSPSWLVARELNAVIHPSQVQGLEAEPEAWLLVTGEGSQARGWGGRMWQRGHMFASQNL